MTWKKKLR